MVNGSCGHGHAGDDGAALLAGRCVRGLSQFAPRDADNKCPTKDDRKCYSISLIRRVPYLLSKTSQLANKLSVPRLEARALCKFDVISLIEAWLISDVETAQL